MRFFQSTVYSQLSKIIALVSFLLLTHNVCQARASFGLSIDAPVYYGAPPVYYGAPAPTAYYGPPPGYVSPPPVMWVRGHWYNGYWIPGQYIEYAGPPPGVGLIWIQGGYYHHHWRQGHWGHRY